MHGRIRERFGRRVVVADGAMGSELLSRLPAATHLDLAVVEVPQQVLAVHLDYIQAGAELIETASFAASRPRLARLGAGDRVEALNAAAVKLAREAREIAGSDCLIAGSIGPLAGVVDLDEPDGPALIAAAHAEQAAALAGRGADLLILETFFRVDELRLAVQAVRGVTGLPLVALLTVPDEKLAEGADEHARDAATLFELDLLAAGVNCAPGPQGLLEIIEALPPVEGLIGVMPNAGTFVRRDGRFMRPPATPAYLAAFARRAAALGCNLVGGCCGTGPEHIRAMADALRGVAPVPRHAAPVVIDLAPTPERRRPESSFAARLAAGEFVRVVQLDPPRGTNADRLLELTGRLAGHPGVDAIDINSNPLARLRMDALWLAAEVQRTTGCETIPHVTPRDASLMGLQSQLLGAWRAGVRNLLAVTGDPSQLGDYPGVHDVYHVDVFELVRAVSRMAEGFDCAGNPIGEPPAFCIGVAVNPCADDLGHELDRLRRKADAGAHFCMSQVFFDPAPWERLLDRCGGRLPLPALVAVWPLTSLRLAQRLHDEVPGIYVPDDLLAALETAGPDAARLGFERAAALLAAAPQFAAGAYLIAPFRQPEQVLGLLAGCTRRA